MTAETLTLREIEVLRADAEARVLQLLTILCLQSGLDLRGVTVHLITEADERGEPRTRPAAVRIDLTV